MVITEFHPRRDRVGKRQHGRTVVRHLAAVYAEHPDYDQEWKP